jgi:murein DD-endopeptidase MepM/ murein hydrolase activator NlpD
MMLFNKKRLTVIALLVFLYFLIKPKKMKYPVSGKITSNFGNRIHPITGVVKFHNGIDIAVPIGTKVYAPASGRIVKIMTNDVGGKQLILQHDNGYSTGYAHLEKNDFFPIGSLVNKGDIIALSGNTGQSTGAHLHLTLRDKSGQFINPKSVFYV